MLTSGCGRRRPALISLISTIAILLAVAALPAAGDGTHGSQLRARGPFESHVVILKYAASAPAADRAEAARDAGVTEKVSDVDGVGAQVVRVKGDPLAAIEQLRASGVVAFAELNYVMRTTAVPNDPRFGELYGIHNTGQAGGTVDADLDGPEGWDLAGLSTFPATGGVKVGIVDTGIDKTHEDLAGKTVDCAGVKFGLLGIVGGNPTPTAARGCTDDNDHGSHVAGTIAGIANNGKGVTGVAFNSPLGICKALNASGSGTTAAVANCITYLVNRGARVVSLSLGGPASTTLQTAVRNAYNNGNGALIVAAAGNDGNATLNYPAAYAEVISVAATDRNDAHASFSNTNADVELAAAGVDVLSVQRGGGYAVHSGTSMATPHVAGVAAVVMGRLGLNAAATRARLDAAADDLGAPGRDPQFGFGRVNLARALS